jgi:hypothetical protein
MAPAALSTSIKRTVAKRRGGTMRGMKALLETALALTALGLLVMYADPASSQDGGRRMAPPHERESSDPEHKTIQGTILRIESMMDRDGPLWIFLDTGAGKPVKLVFESLYTRPRPSDDRVELGRRLGQLEVGDRIRVAGYWQGEAFAIGSMRRVDEDGNEPALTLDLDEDWLLIIRQLPLGVARGDLDRMLIGHGARGEDGELEVSLYGYDATLEFEFEDGALASYRFFVRDLDETTATELFDWLRKFYSSAFEALESEDAGPGSVRWKGEKFTIVLDRAVESGAQSVVWGFER